MRDAVRTCLQIAGGLTEATRRKAVEAARGLLDQAGVDVGELQRSIGERIPKEVQTLADELIASGRANRDLLLGLIREEVDKTMGRVGWIADEITKVGVILEALERRVRNLEAEEPEPARDHAPAGGRVATPPAEPPRAAPAEPPVHRTPARRATPSPAKITPPAMKRVAAKKAAAKKAAAKKTAEKPPAAQPPTAKKAAPAKKSAPAEKAVAKKAAPAKKAAAAKKATTAVAKKAAPAKKTPAAKKATPARKTAAAKKTATAANVKKTTPRKPAGDE